MALTETQGEPGFNPEKNGQRILLSEFFGKAEREHPTGAKELVAVIGTLVPETAKTEVTREQLHEKLTPEKLGVGFSVLNAWLFNVLGGEGVKGFENDPGVLGKLLLSTAKTVGVRLPDKAHVAGKETQTVLRAFSRHIREGLEVELTPRDIVGALLVQSIGSQGIAEQGSKTVRTMLEKATNGRLDWLREALGVPDMAPKSTTAKQSVARELPNKKPAEPIARKERVSTEIQPFIASASLSWLGEKYREAVSSTGEKTGRVEAIISLFSQRYGGGPLGLFGFLISSGRTLRPESSELIAVLERDTISLGIRHFSSRAAADQEIGALYDQTRTILEKSALTPRISRDQFVEWFKIATFSGHIHPELRATIPDITTELACKVFDSYAERPDEEFDFDQILHSFPYLPEATQQEILAEASRQVSKQTGKPVKLTTEEFFKYVKLDAKGRGITI